MANDPQDSQSTESREPDRLPNHCAEIVNPPNRWKLKAHVHLCIRLGPNGEAMSCAMRGWMSIGGAPRRRLPKS